MPIATKQVIEVIMVQLGAAAVKADDLIVEDLGAESADIVSIISALESRFNVRIDDAAIPDIHTVADLIELVSGHIEAD